MNKPELLSLILLKADNVQLVEHFCKAGVEFLVVGGAAVAIHGCRDVTDVDDLDLLASPTIENARRIFSAFAAAQVCLSASPESLAKHAVQIPVKNWRYRVDILTPRKGFDFNEMLSASMGISFKSWTLHVVSRNDLLKMKDNAICETDLERKNMKKISLYCEPHNLAVTPRAATGPFAITPRIQ